MTLQATSSYIWIQQAFLVLFMGWNMEAELFDAIRDAISLMSCAVLWASIICGLREAWLTASPVQLRCLPILLAAAFIPAPYGLAAPPDLQAFLLFLLTLFLGLFNVAAFCMLIYMLSFFYHYS